MPYKIIIDHDDGVTLKEIAADQDIDFSRGEGYYELVKKEKVSAKKKLVVFKDGKFLTDDNATVRKLLGVGGGDVEIVPEKIPAGHQLFVQSTSPNRKISEEASVLFVVDHADEEDEDDGGKEEDQEDQEEEDEEESDDRSELSFDDYDDLLYETLLRRPDMFEKPQFVGCPQATTLHITARSNDNYPDEELYRCRYIKKTKTCRIDVIMYEAENHEGHEVVRVEDGAALPENFTTLIMEYCSGDESIVLDAVLKSRPITTLIFNKCASADYERVLAGDTGFDSKRYFDQLRQEVQAGRALTLIVDGKYIYGGPDANKHDDQAAKKQRTA